MVKRKNVSAAANVLDIRYLKRSRPKGNASVSFAIPDIPSASQSILDVPLDPISKHHNSNIHLERYEGDSDQPDN